jgi:hypothetical protein
MAKRLHDMCEYESNIPIGHSLNRTEWNFRESVRRYVLTQELGDFYAEPSTEQYAYFTESSFLLT